MTSGRPLRRVVFYSGCAAECRVPFPRAEIALTGCVRYPWRAVKPVTVRLLRDALVNTCGRRPQGAGDSQAETQLGPQPPLRTGESLEDGQGKLEK